jgi:hypothetical protein
MHDERAPAASDVEESLARMEAQLPADEIELGLLRLVERHRGRREVGARVHHSVIEPQPVEVVADVVVILNRCAIALRLVRPPRRCDLALGATMSHVGRGPVVLGKGEKLAHHGREDERRPKLAVDGVGDRDRCREFALDVDVARQVRLDDRQLARRQQHAAKRARAREGNRESSIGQTSRLDAAVPIANVEAALRRRAEQRCDHAFAVSQRR